MSSCTIAWSKCKCIVTSCGMFATHNFQLSTNAGAVAAVSKSYVTGSRKNAQLQPPPPPPAPPPPGPLGLETTHELPEIVPSCRDFPCEWREVHGQLWLYCTMCGTWVDQAHLTSQKHRGRLYWHTHGYY